MTKLIQHKTFSARLRRQLVFLGCTVTEWVHLKAMIRLILPLWNAITKSTFREGNIPAYCPLSRWEFQILSSTSTIRWSPGQVVTSLKGGLTTGGKSHHPIHNKNDCFTKRLHFGAMFWPLRRGGGIVLGNSLLVLVSTCLETILQNRVLCCPPVSPLSLQISETVDKSCQEICKIKLFE